MNKISFFIMIAAVAASAGVVIWSFNRPLKGILRGEVRYIVIGQELAIIEPIRIGQRRDRLEDTPDNLCRPPRLAPHGIFRHLTPRPKIAERCSRKQSGR